MPRRQPTGRMRKPDVDRAKFEQLLEAHMRAYRLPPATPQWKFAEACGRLFRADFGWPEYSLGVEVEGGIWIEGGGAHSHPLDLERDIERRQYAVLLGVHLLPFTPKQIESRHAIAVLQRVLASRGWKGPLQASARGE